MNTEMDVVIYMYSKQSPDYIDSEYIWVHGSNSIDSMFLLKYHFWNFQPYTGKGRGMTR